MKAKAVRLHAANDLRLDEFELPEIKDDEILVKVVSDSICMSTYKCAILGTKHKRVHEDVADHPAIMGHEFAGDIVKVGAKHADKFKPGMKFTIQPALNYKGTMWSPGYSYEFCGGDATYCILPAEVMECDCLLEYTGEAYYQASLAEPMSCSIGAFHAAYHTQMGVYTHEMGIREGGKLAIVAGAGPMGLGALTYALHCDRRPALVCVADINQDRLDRAAELFDPAEVKAECGVEVSQYGGEVGLCFGRSGSSFELAETDAGPLQQGVDAGGVSGQYAVDVGQCVRKVAHGIIDDRTNHQQVGRRCR